MWPHSQLFSCISITWTSCHCRGETEILFNYWLSHSVHLWRRYEDSLIWSQGFKVHLKLKTCSLRSSEIRMSVSSSGLEKCVSAMDALQWMGAVRMRVNGCSAVNGCRQNESQWMLCSEWVPSEWESMDALQWMGAVRMRVNGCSAVNGCRQNESLIKTSQHSSPSVNIWRRQKLKQIQH